jgi:hypothetical protein
MEQHLNPEPCRLPLIANAVGFPTGVALEVVLHRIRKIQEAMVQLAEWEVRTKQLLH